MYIHIFKIYVHCSKYVYLNQNLLHLKAAARILIVPEHRIATPPHSPAAWAGAPILCMQDRAGSVCRGSRPGLMICGAQGGSNQSLLQGPSLFQKKKEQPVPFTAWVIVGGGVQQSPRARSPERFGLSWVLLGTLLVFLSEKG